MRLLLDSHAALWFWNGSALLRDAARLAIESSSNEKFVRVVTAWEVAIKVGLGKLKLSVPYDELFPAAIIECGFSSLPLTFEHCRELLNLPFHHRDPFDRALIAQAKVDGLTLVSNDSVFTSYAVSVLW